ncbi:MAG: YIP1 family protein [Ardenticatenaceae bacterium]|nr:YIP1 family protein [Ardenticatenaceae bacterium]
MLDRIIGVLKLDVNTFEAIEADESATSQAAIVVAVVAIVGGLIGGGISAAMGGSFLGSFLRQLLGAFIGWFIWAGVTYFVGTSMFGGKSTMGEMLRVLGFAQAPGILGIIPVCGSFVGWVWTLACTFIAIRQGLDLDNSKAAMTAVVALIAVIIASLIIGAILAAVGLAAGAGMSALQGLGG